MAHNYIELAYENLVWNPEQELKKILEFIGGNYSREMLAFHTTADRYIRNEPWKARELRPVNRKSIGRGTRELSETKTFIIEKLAGRLLQSSGYERSKTNLNIELIAPFVFLGEVLKYFRHRYERNKSQGQGDDAIIYSDRSRFYHILLKSILMKGGCKLTVFLNLALGLSSAHYIIFSGSPPTFFVRIRGYLNIDSSPI